MAEQYREYEIPDLPESDVSRRLLSREDFKQVMSKAVKSWDELYGQGGGASPDDLGPPARLIRPRQPEGGDGIALPEPREKLAA